MPQTAISVLIYRTPFHICFLCCGLLLLVRFVSWLKKAPIKKIKYIIVVTPILAFIHLFGPIMVLALIISHVRVRQQVISFADICLFFEFLCNLTWRRPSLPVSTSCSQTSTVIGNSQPVFLSSCRNNTPHSSSPSKSNTCLDWSSQGSSSLVYVFFSCNCALNYSVISAFKASNSFSRALTWAWIAFSCWQVSVFPSIWSLGLSYV